MKNSMAGRSNLANWAFCTNCLILGLLLVLTSGCALKNHQDKNENNSLLIPVEWIFENASYVNEILNERGVQNVKVLTPEEARVWLNERAFRLNKSRELG